MFPKVKTLDKKYADWLFKYWSKGYKEEEEMRLQSINYKQILDNEGYFKALEIWQGDQHITVTLKDETFMDGPSGEFNWGAIKKTIDGLQEQNKKHIAERIKAKL